MAIKKIKLKNILITGGAGFIGSHLVDKLVKLGKKIAVVDNLSSGRKENVNKKARFYKMDVRDSRLSDVIKREKIETIFHLAAQPIVETAYDSPLETIEINIMGTANVLEVCRKNGKLKSIIIVSSDKAYGKNSKLPYTEETPLNGDHPYEVSKTAADLIAKTYANTYGLPVAITRFSNVYGPGDTNFSRIVPGALEAIIKNKELLIRSDGKMIREYTYVKDIADGCIILAEDISKTRGNAFNFGSRNIFSVIETVKRIGKILDAKINYKILNIAKNEISKQYLDWTKAKRELGWRPKTNFEEGIKESFKWYKKYFEK